MSHLELMVTFALSVVVNFLIIAFILFQLVKNSNRMKKEQPATPPAPTTTEKLLIEIRDAIATNGFKK